MTTEDWLILCRAIDNRLSGIPAERVESDLTEIRDVGDRIGQLIDKHIAARLAAFRLGVEKAIWADGNARSVRAAREELPEHLREAFDVGVSLGAEIP